jgi:hypothetical protein
MKDRMNPDELEKFIHRTLRSLPDRHAPATLEARVRAALESRAATPWWHQSWSYWPFWARAVFLLVCGGLAGLLVYLGVAVRTNVGALPLNTTFASVLHLFQSIVGLGRVLAECLAVIGRNIPSVWLYGIVLFVGGLYAMLFGLGTAAYRTLWADR